MDQEGATEASVRSYMESACIKARINILGFMTADGLVLLGSAHSCQSPDRWDILSSPTDSNDHSKSSMDIDSSVQSLPVDMIKSSQEAWHLPSNLRKALRKHVHDQMPIRLLSFLPDGSEMELVERNEVFHRIVRDMKTQLDQATYEEMIYDKSLESTGNQQITLADAEETIISTLVQKHTRYAILSHTWIRNEIGEVEYKDWQTRTSKGAGYEKLRMFCDVAARQHGVTYAWMDSVCINKESSSELDESIRSMYQWYRDSHICLTFLSDTTSIANMRHDDWFRRGWTLQELLAPPRLKFHDKNWNPLTSAGNDKSNSEVKDAIEAATHITSHELISFTSGYEQLSDNIIPISRRMLWAANREVTRGEDTAYSLMGIFGVSLSIAYGEGAERAFFRLVKKILNSVAEVWDIFNCAGPLQSDCHSYHSRVIPSSPRNYLHRSTLFNDLDYGVSNTPREPITLTHLGLRVRLLLIPAAELSNQLYVPFGRYSGTVTAHLQGSIGLARTYNLMDRKAFYTSTWDRRRSTHVTVAFGILNFVEDNDTVSIPGNCLAFGFWFYNAFGGQLTSSKGRKQVMKTDKPIVFQLASNYTYSQYMSTIDKKDLKKEGMELMSLYL